MKKIVTMLVGAAALATVTAGMAAHMNNTNSMDVASNDNSAAGLFVSGDMGYGNVDVTNANVAGGTTTPQVSHSHLAWAAHIGYQFNKYFAVESGYTSFGAVKLVIPEADINANVVGKAYYSGVDLLAKGILPINDQFSLFGKAGVVYLHSNVDVSASQSGVTVFGENDSSWTAAPELGMGAAYNVTQNAAINVQAIHAFDEKPAVTAYLAGVSYKFAV